MSEPTALPELWDWDQDQDQDQDRAGEVSEPPVEISPLCTQGVTPALQGMWDGSVGIPVFPALPAGSVPPVRSSPCSAPSAGSGWDRALPEAREAFGTSREAGADNGE